MDVQRLLICGFCLVAGSWVQQVSALDVAAAPQKYRHLIAASDVVAILRNKFILAAPLEVSQLRPSVLTQLGDWAACLRVSVSAFKSPPPSTPNAAPAQRRPQLLPLNYYVFFFTDGAIVDSRPAVIIDRCAEMTYSPLPQPSKKKTPD